MRESRLALACRLSRTTDRDEIALQVGDLLGYGPTFDAFERDEQPAVRPLSELQGCQKVLVVPGHLDADHRLPGKAAAGQIVGVGWQAQDHALLALVLRILNVAAYQLVGQNVLSVHGADGLADYLARWLAHEFWLL